MELTPYQQKRKVKYSEETSTNEAITKELLSFWEKSYPKIFEHLKSNPALLDNLVLPISNVSSPVIVEDNTLPWTINRVQALLESLLTLEEICEVTSTKLPKRRYQFLPPPYRKYIKRLFTSQKTLELLSTAVSSKKRAKKTLRILHKRIGFYTQKKVPFKASTGKR